MKDFTKLKDFSNKEKTGYNFCLNIDMHRFFVKIYKLNVKNLRIFYD